ncbi:MAG: methyltransferase domain-containing protein [Gemmatimonadaceae bacterium]
MSNERNGAKGQTTTGDEVKKTTKRNSARGTTGLVIHWAARYDLLIWLVTLGRERKLRESLLRPARLQSGESVLDVGCGTGTLAIAAKRSVGPAGSVHGVDASPAMIARARKKAKKAGAEVIFETGLAESLPFPDARFDVVLSTVMLHHLPRKTRQQGVCEMRRVLKPGGRLLAVDFGGASRNGRGPLAHFHRHGHIEPRELVDLVSHPGLHVLESGALGIWDLQFVLAEAPRT